MTDIIKQKDYPTNYPADAIKIISTMSFTGTEHVKLVGSQSIRSQKYAGDYDIYNEVKLNESSQKTAISKIVRKFQSVVAKLKTLSNVFVGDIKAGLVPEWEIITDNFDDYDASKSRAHLKALLDEHIITKYEYEDALPFIKADLSRAEWLIAKNNIKFHIVRWTPALVKLGKQKLRDGRQYTLQEAVQAPSIIKIDAIGLVSSNRFSEFSCIYQIFNKGTPINPIEIDITKSLNDAILSYTEEGKLFKVLKRKFSLAKLKNDTKTVKKLNPILQSDLGLLYVIQSDMATLVALLDYSDAPIDLIKKEMDEFVNRFSNVYSIKEFLKIEPKLIEDIHTALKFKSKARLIARLKVIGDELERVLNNSVKSVLKGSGRCSYRPVIR